MNVSVVFALEQKISTPIGATGKQQQGEKMSSSENQDSKSTSAPIDAGLTKESLLQLRAATGHADTGCGAGTSFETSPAPAEVPDSGMSPLSSSPAGLEGDNLFAFYPSAGHPSEEHRPSLVDAVIEQLRHARVKRQRPH